MKNKVTIIGAGLAGVEAAYQLAKRDVEVNLIEMKPVKFSPAHKSENFAELVCSNSLRSNSITNAVGLLKEELRLLDSVVMKVADSVSVPAGGALAVNRDLFSEKLTNIIKSFKNIHIEYKEAIDIPDGNVIIATGPLSSEAMCECIKKLTNEEGLHFFDAAAPIITNESIDYNFAFMQSRYNKGDDDYVNCPMNKEEYLEFYNNLVNAKVVELHDFETKNVFEGCMPIEVMALRGVDTMLYGPLKPVGLRDPKTGKRPYAVVQLRKENKEGTMFNIVGFQTHLLFGEQKRVFGLIPALKNAEYVRYGFMHKNTFINSPKLLDSSYTLRSNKNITFAGQITGVEGYIESTSSGMLAAINIYRRLNGLDNIDFTNKTAIGALSHYVSTSQSSDFQPMNVTFSLMAPSEETIFDKAKRKEYIASRALNKIREIIDFYKI